MPAGATVIPFPPVYRIGYSDGDQIGLVEDMDGRPIAFRRFERAAEAMALLKTQHPALLFWVSWRPN